MAATIAQSKFLRFYNGMIVYALARPDNARSIESSLINRAMHSLRVGADVSATDEQEAGSRSKLISPGAFNMCRLEGLEGRKHVRDKCSARPMTCTCD